MNLSSIINYSKKSFLFATKKLEWKDFDKKLAEADIGITFQEYISVVIFLSLVSFFIALFFSTIFVTFALSGIGIGFVFLVSIFIFIMAFMIGVTYPYYRVAKKKQSIKANLALAILGMATVGQSGVPPQYMFESIAKERKDYPFVAGELSKIVRYINDLGMSLSEAIETLSQSTVSEELKTFLTELKATLESGGDLNLYMLEKSEQAAFEYGLRIEEANKRAELFGDIYTAVVIAAPLFIFSAVMLIGLFGGVVNVDMNLLLNLGIFLLIPGVNLGFLLIMEMTSPTG